MVTGASGGVGSYAIQLAKAYGAEVTGVCSNGKAEFVRALGTGQVLSSDINAGRAIMMMDGDEDYDEDHVEKYL